MKIYRVAKGNIDIDITDGTEESLKNDSLSKLESDENDRSLLNDIDNVYFNAISNGQNHIIQNIVNSYAKGKMPNTKAVNNDGTLMYLYHQTANEFNVFDLKSTETKGSGGRLEYRIPYAIYTKISPEPIALAGSNQYQLKLFLNIENPIRVQDRNGLSMFLREELNGFAELEDELISQRESNIRYIALSDDPAATAKSWTDQYEKLAINMKRLVDNFFRNDISHDSIIMEQDQKQTSYIVFNTNQVKLAAPITKNGDTIIPLSKRFDFSNSDIRY